MRIVTILIIVCVLLLGSLIASGLMDREHRQRVRVSDAFMELHAYYDGFRNQPGALDRSTLRLPKHFHEDLNSEVSDMPDTIDYTIDVVGERLVATFGKQQDDVSGLTVFILLKDRSGPSLKCGGSVPVKYLPVICR